jgi:hypothetical protein
MRTFLLSLGAVSAWLIEITFLSGRASNIDWYRPRP